ncbi:MAG: hypothetical protein HXY29_14935, partial [Rhodocyclaceae bacterium]|nr:hypothetical protein [Rhodocyclaceae bacterium]
ALADLWDAVFRYNFAYSAHNPLTQRVMSVFVGWYVLFPSGIMLFAVVGWIGGVLFTLRNRERLGAGKALVYASLIALPAEWALTATSGFLFEHYFTTWLPVCAVLSGLFAHALMTSDRIRKVHNGVWVFAALALASAVPASKWISAARSQDYARDQAVVAYIVNTTSQDDEVLMWGAATAFNFTTGRRSPTRFHYQYPLYTAGYQNAAMIEQFLDDIRRSQPKLIIDTTPVIGVIPSLEPSRRQTWEPSPTYQALPEMERVYAYVESNYRLIGTVGWAQWPVYVRNGVDDTRFRRELSIP